jgi:hypothetical protein
VLVILACATFPSKHQFLKIAKTIVAKLAPTVIRTDKPVDAVAVRVTPPQISHYPYSDLNSVAKNRFGSQYSGCVLSRLTVGFPDERATQTAAGDAKSTYVD